MVRDQIFDLSNGGTRNLESCRRLNDNEIRETMQLFSVLDNVVFLEKEGQRQWCDGKFPFAVKFVAEKLSENRREIVVVLGLENFFSTT